MDETGVKLHERVARVETSVDEIKNNHLPHIEAKIDRAFWLLITTLIGVASLLLNLLLK